jgi:hypothetical protein
MEKRGGTVTHCTAVLQMLGVAMLVHLHRGLLSMLSLWEPFVRLIAGLLLGLLADNWEVLQTSVSSCSATERLIPLAQPLFSRSTGVYEVS